MTERVEIERVINAAYAALIHKDMDALRKILAEDARFQIAGSKLASAIAAKTVGYAEYFPLLKEMITVFELLDHHVLTMVVEGSKAAVHWRGKIRSSVTGETVETELFDLLEISNGRISSVVVFWDTALAHLLMNRASGQSAS
jgi:ketosteroid isomerase-like protein